jgi:hypothetical protein
MILKASQRAGGQNLAVHLMRADDNEHIDLHELRGFASDNLKGAFREAEATAKGTRCRQYLFSLSLSPPAHAHVTADTFRETIDRIEKRLGLEGQPRAIVFHEKGGRRHAHCVWSRIDADTMTARQLSFFKTKLMGISRELYLEQGWDMPPGIAKAGQRNPLNFTLAEWQQAKRQGTDPRETRQLVQTSWRHSDSPRAFARSLEEHGLFLAKGDRRSFVMVDHAGDIHALPRLLDLKTKDVRARLGDGDQVPGVEDTKALIARRMTPAIRRHIEESKARFREQSSVLAGCKAKLTQDHRQARTDLSGRQRDEWQRETRERAGRLPKGLAGLWHRITGKYQQVRSLNESEAKATQDRHANERERLIETQREERSRLQERFRELRKGQAEQLLELRREIGRYLKFSRGDPAPARARKSGLGLKLER